MKKFTLVTLIVLLSVCFQTVYAQLSSYGFSQSVENYVEISGGYLLGNALTDDHNFVNPAVPLGGNTPTGPGFPIGFNFTFDGVVFDRLAVNANGWISLGQSALNPSVNINSSDNYTPIASSVPITPPYLVSRIAGFVTDLVAQPGASLRIETIGQSPNRVCVIQWKNFTHYWDAGNYSFQIRLHETSNWLAISFTGIAPDDYGDVAQVGVRGAPANNPFSNYANRTTMNNWNATTAGVSPSDWCNFTSNIKPQPGLIFWYKPSLGNNPPNCANLQLPLDGAVDQLSKVKLQWSDGGENPTGYKIYLGTDNPPTNVLNGIDVGNVTSYIHNPGLEYSTTYNWKVVAYNNFGDAQNCPVRSFTVMSDPGIVDFPFIESFETGNVNGSQDIYLWSQELVGNSNYSWTASNLNFQIPSRTGEFKVTLFSTGHAWLFRPFYFEVGMNYIIELWATQTQSNWQANIGIYLGLQPESSSMTSTIASQQPVFSNSYQKVSGGFVVPESGIYFIGIRGDNNSGVTYLAMDDIMIFEADVCLAPTTLAAANVTAGSATLSWMETGLSTKWNIEWGPTGFTQGSGNLIQNVTSNPYQLNDLEVATVYDFYVQSVCAVDDVSEWAGPMTFGTKMCLPENECSYNFLLLDSWGDGWNGATMQLISQGSVIHVLGLTFTNGNQFTELVGMCHNTDFQVFWNNGGSYANEVGLKITDPFGEVVFHQQILGTNNVGTTVYSGTASCFLPECFKPIALNAINIGNNSADLTWTSLNGEASWNIEWGLAGFSQGSGNILNAVNTNPYQVNGLAEGVKYEFYVQAVCENGQSVWAGPSSFFTSCNPITLPFSENFEGENFPPVCWRSYDADGVNPGWVSDDLFNQTPGGTLTAFHKYNNSFDQDGWLITPAIALSDYSMFRLKFWSLKLYWSSINGKNSVLVSTGSPVPSDGGFVEIWNDNTPVASWSETILSLDAFAGQTIYIAFRYEGKAAHSWYLDDVSVYYLTTGALSGYVTSAVDEPIPGARVFSGNYETFSDATGYYEFPSIITGLYDFTCEAENFHTQSATSIEVSTNQTTTLDFVLDFSQITVNPQSLSEVLQPGGSSVQQITIANPNGTGDLDWQAYIVYQQKGKANNIQYPVLWDNTAINPTTFGSFSFELTGIVPDGRVITADDFMIPLEEIWEIRYVYTEGFSVVSKLPDAFKVAFFTNNAGQPGELISVQQVIPDDLNFNTQHLYLPNPIALPTGHYWLSVYAVYFGSTNPANTRWNWSLGSSPVQSSAKVNDYAGLSGSQGWYNVETYPSCYFKIGGYVNSWLNLSQYSGAIQPGQSQVVDVEFYSEFLTEGQFEAEIRFIHNGQEVTESELGIPVFLTVAATMPPNPPFNPTPATAEIMVDLQPHFEWSNGVGTTQTKIRIEKVAFPLNQLVYESGFFTGSSFDLASVGTTLLPKTAYRWRVTCKNSIGETAGAWWHFETIGKGTISGSVKDAFTNIPLQGVTIKAGSDYQTNTLATGIYLLSGVVEGTYEVTASFDGYLPQTKTISIVHGASEILDFNLTLALKQPYALKATVSNIFDVNLTWKSPETGGEEWLYYHDGSFENAIGSANGLFGLAQLFTPAEYPCKISKVRYFNDGFGSYQQEMKVYVLSGDGAQVLAGPFTITNAAPNSWVSVDVGEATINEGNFMVATLNTFAGGPAVGVDNSNYNGTLYFGSVGNFTELGNFNYYYVGSHEAFVTYGEGGKEVLNASAQKPQSVDKMQFADNLPIIVERTHPSVTAFKENETLLGYNLYRNGEFVAYTENLEYNDLNLGAGEYTYTVTAVYLEGESVNSLPAEAGIMSPPVLLSAKQQGAEIHLAWESKFTGLENNPFTPFFVLFRNGVKIGEFFGNSYTDQAIEPGTNYCYKLFETISESLETGFSNEICVQIPDYGILSATPVSLSEVHANGVTLTTQTLLLHNVGNGPVSFGIEKEYLFNSKNLKSSGFCTTNLYSVGCKNEDGVIQWELANVSAHIPCDGSPGWYKDFTDLNHFLQPGQTYQLKIMARSMFTFFSVWIDFDDDKVLTENEAVINSFQISVPYTWYTYEFAIPEDAPIGKFGMRMRSRASDPVYGPCDTYSRGNAADFTVIIGQPWLEHSQKSGAILPGESMEIEVTFNSSMLDLGTYFAQLNIQSSNPFISQPELIIPLKLAVTETIAQQITLPMGWSGWSSYIDLSPANEFASVVAPIVDDLIISIHFNQVFYPAYNINTMNPLNNQHGYIIKMANSRLLTLEGMMASQTTTLNAGWNILPVLSPCNIEADALLGGISGLIIAYEVAGNGVYYPEFNINTLQTLVPGKAYYIKVQNVVEVTFPACGKNAASGNILPVRATNITPWNDPVYSGSSHIAIFDNNAISRLHQGDLIGAFTSEGRCAGLVQVTGNAVSMSLFGDDFTSSSKDGFEDGELITFKLYRSSNASEYALDVVYSLNAPDTDGRFSNNGLSVVHGVTMNSTGMAGVDLNELAIYPNPSTGIFNISNGSNISNTAWEVFDTMGQLIARGEITETTTIDLTSYPRGLYFIHLKGNDVSRIEKLVVR